MTASPLRKPQICPIGADVRQVGIDRLQGLQSHHGTVVRQNAGHRVFLLKAALCAGFVDRRRQAGDVDVVLTGAIVASLPEGAIHSRMQGHHGPEFPKGVLSPTSRVPRI